MKNIKTTSSSSKIFYPLYIFLGIVVVFAASLAFAYSIQTERPRDEHNIGVVSATSLPPMVSQTLMSELALSSMNLFLILRESEGTYEQVIVTE